METAQINPAGAVARMLTTAAARLRALWHSQSKPKALFVRETAALGERRFVAVIEFEGQRFLIGGSPASVTLLAPLRDEPSRGDSQ